MILRPEQLDALREMVNIGVGQAAGVLNAMLRSHIILRLPIVEVLAHAELKSRVAGLSKGIFSAVRIGFKGPFVGNASLIFPAASAAKLVVLLTDDDRGATDMDAIKVGTLTEVGNIVLNGVMGAIGNELQQRVYYSVPFYLEDPLGILLAGEALENKSDVIWIQTQFTVQEHQVEGDIVILFSAGSLEMLVAAIDRVLDR